MKTLFGYLSAFFLLVLLSCGEDDTETGNQVIPVAVNNTLACEVKAMKGDRKIGLDLLNLTERNGFGNNLQLAKELGVEFIALHLNWTSIETSPNTFEDLGDALFLLNQTAEQNNFEFSLTIRPIDLSGKYVPTDLNSMRFNDPTLIDRFKKLIDFVFTRVNSKILLNFQIGNEIDGFDASKEAATFWSDYKAFLIAIREHIQLKEPKLKVGFTGTLYGLNSQTSRFNDLLTVVDYLGVNYYPLKSNFEVQEPSVLATDFDLLLANYPQKSIYVQEVGYQSSAVCNSSEEKQSDFFCQFFTYWDNHTDRIKSMNIVRLNDLSRTEAENSAIPYGITDQKFIEYLRSLGIRSYAGQGTNKKAFETIRQNLKERGW